MEKKRKSSAASGKIPETTPSEVMSDLKERILILENQVENLKASCEALREGKEYFEDIFETVNEGIALTTLRGKVLAINSNLEKILGVQSEKLVGRNILRLASDLLTPGNFETIFPILRNLLRGTKIEPFKIDYKDRILEITANINQNTKRLTGTVRDITLSVKTEEELSKSIQRLRRAELASKSGNWELHMDTGKIIGSEGALKLYGFDQYEVDYSVIKGVPLPEYREMMDNAVKELIENGKPYNLEFRIKHPKTGEFVDIHSVCEYDSKNRILFGSIKDITDRKKAEIQIKDKSNDLANLLDITIELLETVDRKRILERIVKGIPGHKGFESGAIYFINGNELYLETTNPPLPENFPDEFRRAELKNHPHITKAIETRKQVIICDTGETQLTPEEKVISEGRNLRSIIYIPLLSGRKAIGVLIFGTVGIQQDYTEDELDMCRVLSNISSLALENSFLVNNLRVAKDKAEESDRLKTAFLHNISHEIRTPLNAIVGFSGFLDQPGLPDDERKEYIDIIFQSNNQLLSIINDILNISQIETGQIAVVESSADLNLIMKNLYKQYSDIARRSGLEFRLKMDLAGKDNLILTDENKLKQVLGNLLNNAFKFTHSGFVELRVARESDSAVFYVEDSGIGIPESEQTRIFERFYQVDKTVSRLYGGTGLGLSISGAFVNMLGGSFSVSSVPGKGSKFSFRIPWKEAVMVPSEKKVPIMEKTYDGSKKTILVAEDEESNYALIYAILKPHGFTILRADNGRQAVDICMAKPELDLVLMDIKMPVLDGYDATKEILKIRPGLKVIAQTAYAHSDDRGRALASGCIDCLIKPFDRKQLLEIIQKHLK